ncbi:hypothetical protein, partial [Candidatus Protofrankia californiensis]|uniref:hypothetical protein n=1 Tax=Candidatus Protofrankia californiensis TaxID=1839754 RepID=UPI0019D13511
RNTGGTSYKPVGRVTEPRIESDDRVFRQPGGASRVRAMVVDRHPLPGAGVAAPGIGGAAADKCRRSRYRPSGDPVTREPGTPAAREDHDRAAGG